VTGVPAVRNQFSNDRTTSAPTGTWKADQP